MIRVVLFDYGGVLTEGGTSGGMTRLVADTLGITVEEAQRASSPLRDLLLGVITTAEFLQALSKLFPDVPSPEHLRQGAAIFTPSEPVYELAKELRARGIRTAILSNMFADNAGQLRKNGLYDGFDPVMLSCEEHLAKPDEAVYRRAVEKLQVRPEEILFIDDQERFLAPARTMGMRVLLATSPAQIVADTRRMVFGENAPAPEHLLQ